MPWPLSPRLENVPDWKGRQTPGSLKASTTFSRTVALSGKGGGVRLLLGEPLMQLFKFARRSWQGIYALLRMHHLFELLRDHFDDL